MRAPVGRRTDAVFSALQRNQSPERSRRGRTAIKPKCANANLCQCLQDQAAIEVLLNELLKLLFNEEEISIRCSCSMSVSMLLCPPSNQTIGREVFFNLQCLHVLGHAVFR